MKKLLLFLPMLVASWFAFPASAVTITVQSGDTLSALAAQYNTTVLSLVQINKIPDPNLIYVGQKIETDPTVGASIPIVVAVYTDSLASRISSSASTFTLTRGTDKQSRSLSGFYGFVMDEGTASEEFMTANCVATACTIVARGIDVVDGKTAVTALKFEHRRGAVTKITNFPQLAVLSRILNGQESASSTFMYGDGSTTTTSMKCIKADNGTANLPKICYNESIAKWTVFDDGLNSVTVASSSSAGLSASSSKGIFITNSLIGVNASGTGGIGFDSNGLAFFTGIANTSTILNGSSNTFSGSATFNGTNNFAGQTFVLTPTGNGGEPVNLVYFLNNMNTATGTAGVNITAGQAVFMSSTSTLFKTNSSVASSTFQFVGIATNTTNTNGIVTFTTPGGKNCQQSGLSAGFAQYLNGTAGQISSTAGTFSARIGLALSSTCLQVMMPKFVVSGSAVLSGTGDTIYSTGFYPALITIRAGLDTPGGAISSISFGDDTNTCVFDEVGAENRNSYNATNAICPFANGSGQTLGTISAKTAFGFTVSISALPKNVAIQWTAHSE